jgi:hypothetical protein
MQQSIEAMIAAVAIVQPALDKFYSLLNDEQKARLNALAEDQRGRGKESRPIARAGLRCCASFRVVGPSVRILLFFSSADWADNDWPSVLTRASPRLFAVVQQNGRLHL